MNNYHCPCCGAFIKPEVQDTTLKGKRWVYTMLTCETDGCEAWMCTTTPDQLLDGSHASKWGFKERFDVRTGESLLLREIEDLKCTCNLMLIVMDNEKQTAAFAEDTAVLDPYTLVTVLRDWSQVLCAVQA